MVARIIQALLDFIVMIVNWVVDLLPQSPFIGLDSSIISEWLGYINYFIPVGQMMSIFALWLSAVGLWYLYRWIFRFVRYID